MICMQFSSKFSIYHSFLLLNLTPPNSPSRHIINSLSAYLFFNSKQQLGKSKELNNKGMKVQFKKAFKSCFIEKNVARKKSCCFHTQSEKIRQKMNIFPKKLKVARIKCGHKVQSKLSLKKKQQKVQDFYCDNLLKIFCTIKPHKYRQVLHDIFFQPQI